MDANTQGRRSHTWLLSQNGHIYEEWTIISSGDSRLMSCFTSYARIVTPLFVWFVFQNIIILLLACKCVANSFLRFSSRCWCLFHLRFIYHLWRRISSSIVVATTSMFLLQIWLVMSRIYKFPILCGMYYKSFLSFVHGLKTLCITFKTSPLYLSSILIIVNWIFYQILFYRIHIGLDSNSLMNILFYEPKLY